MPATASPTEPSSRHLPGFDGLRAIAAVSVLVYHSGFATAFTTFGTGGRYVGSLDVGVTIFFVISGFLLYRPFVAARLDGRPSPSLHRYLNRRVLRIVPAYWLAFLILTVTGYTFDVTAASLPIYLLFLQVYSPDHALGGIPAAWSLCTEMSFYLFLPGYSWCIGRITMRGARRHTLRTEIVGLGGLAVLTIAFRIWVHATDGPGTRLFWLPANLDLFAAGMGLAVLAVVTQRRGWALSDPAARRLATLSWAVAAVAFWAVCNVWDLPYRLRDPVPTTNQQLYRHVCFLIVAVALVTPAVVGAWSGGWVRRFLAHRVVGYVGLVSYGIYLWHQAIITWISDALHGTTDPSDPFRWSVWHPPFLVFVAIVLALCVAVSSLSYFLVERPIMQRGRSIGRRARK
jgi:peptidoglycan/LPS O-acetylase OafA/YrhL